MTDHLPPQADVRVLAGRFEVSLTTEPQIVPATQIVISVTGAQSRNVTLDGKAIRLSSGSTGVLALDLVRSTGYHHLVVDKRSYWFGTEDAKLGLDGIVAMLEELEVMGTGWTGQAMFSSGAGLRDPHVSYGWLDQWADEALRAVESVLNTPRSKATTSQVLRRRGGSGVLLAPTLRLLRSDPQRYLAQHDNGLIVESGQRYNPLRVIARRRDSTLDTPANRRALAVLFWIERLCADVIVARAGTDAVARARLWSNKARAFQQRPLARALGTQTLSTAPRQAEETTEPAYRATYRIAVDLAGRFGWSAAIAPQSRLSYVEQSDVIYQAYAASRLAKELDMRQTGSVLGTKQPAFSGEQFDLYYDTKPPASVLRSWRLYSDRPDDSRPDLLLHERSTGAVAVLDAKYRRARDGGASEDSRKDMSAYMGLYGLAAVTILFPGAHATVAEVAGAGRRIIEAAIAPSIENLDDVVSTVLSTLAQPSF